MQGDCAGNDLAQVTATREECRKQCDEKDTCAGYLYVVRFGYGKKYPHPPCFLKKKMCLTPSIVPSLDIAANFKTTTDGKW